MFLYNQGDCNYFQMISPGSLSAKQSILQTTKIKKASVQVSDNPRPSHRCSGIHGTGIIKVIKYKFLMKKRGRMLRAVVLNQRPFCIPGTFSSIWRHFLVFTMEVGKEEGVLLASSGYKAKGASKHPTNTGQSPTTKNYSDKYVKVQRQ